jgi:hypothetical protein
MKLFKVFNSKDEIVYATIADRWHIQFNRVVFDRDLQKNADISCEFLEGYHVLMDEDDMTNELYVAFSEAYMNNQNDDPHMHFRFLLGLKNRSEAKDLSYVLLYNGCLKIEEEIKNERKES